MSRVHGYQAQNLNVLMEGMKVFVRQTIEPTLMRFLRQKAEQIRSAIDEGSLIPEWTSNLHDATGVGIYNNGVVEYFTPTKKATKDQKSSLDGVYHTGINGSQFLREAISEASARFSRGIWLVIFSATPYAYHININGSKIGRGKGYFKTITDMTLNEILSGLQPLASASRAMI